MNFSRFTDGLTLRRERVRMSPIIISTTKITTKTFRCSSGAKSSASSLTSAFFSCLFVVLYRVGSCRANHAVGVEYINESTANKVIEVARASKLVVISAGALGSPAILERSGIGNKTILEKHGIKQIVDLPGVGENYNGTYYSST
jgi:hypothetical protein